MKIRPVVPAKHCHWAQQPSAKTGLLGLQIRVLVEYSLHQEELYNKLHFVYFLSCAESKVHLWGCFPFGQDLTSFYFNTSTAFLLMFTIIFHSLLKNCIHLFTKGFILLASDLLIIYSCVVLFSDAQPSRVARSIDG